MSDYEYLPRLMDTQLNETLDYICAVLIVGSKWSGLFILTGSNADDKKQITHSGTGRITKLQMYPMSLYESREFNGSISLYEPTLCSYLNIRKRLYVIEDVPACLEIAVFSERHSLPSVRNRLKMLTRKSPRQHFFADFSLFCGIFSCF